MRTSIFMSLTGSFFLLAAVGCGGDGDKYPYPPPATNPTPSTNPTNPNPNPNPNPGTCQNGQRKCSGMSLQVCKSGNWSTDTCDYLCQQSGFVKATSCKYDSDLGYDACFCASSSSGTCTHGEQKCSGLNLGICQNGAWTTATCDFLCQQSGHGKASSCGYDSSKGTEICFCDAAQKCTEGQQKCAGSGGLMVCQGGQWKTQTCNDLCGAAGYGMAATCAYDSSKGYDACSCFNGTTGDPCQTASHCKSGNVCNNAGWCTKACAHDYECPQSTLGDANFCMQLSGGGTACFPGCNSSSDCSVFPGTVCQMNVSTIDTKQTNVCAAP
jgi:hypothetical protein